MRLISSLTISFVALILAAGCSGSSSGHGADSDPNSQNPQGQAPKAPGQDPSTQPTDNNKTAPGLPGEQDPTAKALARNPWCANVADQGQQVQERFTFMTGGILDMTIFSLVNGQRDKSGSQQGVWEVVNNHLLTNVGGMKDDSTVRIDPFDPTTGAPKLYLTSQASAQVLALDPCN